MTLQPVDVKEIGLLRPDYDTIDTVRLTHLPQYKLPPTYQLNDGMGAGCAGDPPGYPSYFLRSVYTSHGNSPAKGPQHVITYFGVHYVVESSKDWDGCKSWEEYRAKIEKRLRRLWKPLPLDHPRTQAWIADKIRHFKGCLVDPRKSGHDRIYCPSVHGEWSAADLMEIAQALGLDITGAEQPSRWHEIVAQVFDLTDAASFFIREHYPEYVKTDPEPEHTGGWYSILAERPTPENCPGEIWSWGKGSRSRHPVNGTWCQVCSHRVE